MDKINWNDFAKVDFRVGEIQQAINVEGSEKLIRMVVDFGELGKKVVYSGIRHWYSPENLVNKKTVFVVNMVPKKVMGEDSEAMIFGGEDEKTDTMSILVPEKDLPNGSKVF